MWTNSYTLEQLGEAIASVRKEKGLTQAELAERVGVSHTTLSNLEQGKSVATSTMLRALQLLGMRLVVVPKTARVTVNECQES